MKKKILATLVVIGAFVAGYSINSIAVSNTNPEFRVAVVDIQKIVASSSEIRALKLDQDKQVKKYAGNN